MRSAGRSTLRVVSEPLDDEAEVLDGLPVLCDEPSTVSPPVRSRALKVTIASPAQTAAAALGGLVAGVAVVGLVHRRRGRSKPALAGARSARRRRRSRGAVGEMVQVVASRSLLVDVHLLGSSADGR